MSSKKKLAADLIFGVQITSALVMAGSQFFRLLESTQGQLISMFVVMWAFLGMNFLLALNAHRTQPSRITWQTLAIYGLWLPLLGSNLVAFFLNGNYVWSTNDTKLVTVCTLGSLGVLLIMKTRRTSFQDPMIKSFLAMVYKVVPQSLMALEILKNGGKGIPGLALLVGHISVLLRIIQIGLALREAGWDRNRLWLGASELANELSWIAVTLAWLLVL